jgi:thiol:disulfide interchange protein
MTSKYVLPAFVAAFALAFLVATPFVLAESGYGMHSYDGAKSHKGHWAIQVQGFEGSIPIPEDMDGESHKSLKDQVTVSLSDAAANYPDVKKAKLGIAVNEDGDKFLVWKLVEFNKNSDSETATMKINIVDAGDADNTITITKNFDKATHHQKWSDYKGMKGHYADMTPEEREAKFAQHKEMRTAFDSLSEEDQTALKSYFQDMKKQFADMTEEEMKAKHAEFKEQMQEFMNLSLEEKISYLKYLALSQRNQA